VERHRVARSLHVEHFDLQQAMRIDLRGIRCHRRGDASFGFYTFVALVADQVGDDLGRL